MAFIFRRIVTIAVLAGPALFWTGPARAADTTTDSQYIKQHFPDAYRRIYAEGEKAGRMKAGATAPAKPDLGAWWETNSLKYSPLPEQWLLHIEGTLDYKHKEGNIDSNLYDGSASLMVRKLRFTNTLTYIINKERTEQVTTPGEPPSLTDSDYRSFQESLRYDLAKRLYAEGGYIWEKDTANYIQGRDSYYAGLGYTLIATPRHLLDLFAAAGYVEEKYPELVRIAMGISRSNTSAGYLRQSYRWNITDRITYKESFRIIQDFASSEVFNDDMTDLRVIDHTHRYRWFLINEIYIKIIDHLSFMVGCKIDCDSNPWPTVKDRDTVIKSGIQFSF
jgi:putative salt-induced outer membrane protein YdiY